jgi:2-phospho-L-lactate transferase/gluconeogenesis factor (CofD/UPF0052 family)
MSKNLSIVSELLIAGLYGVLFALYLGGLITIQTAKEAESIKLLSNYSSIVLLIGSYMIGIVFNVASEWIVRTMHFRDWIDKQWFRQNISENFSLEYAKHAMLHSGKEAFSESIAYHERMERLMRTVALETLILIIIGLFFTKVDHTAYPFIVLIFILSGSVYGYMKRRHWIADQIYGAWLNHLSNQRTRNIAHAPEMVEGTILMLTGGSAARQINTELIKRKYSVIRVLSAFDSGGSSKTLRERFRMPPIGDIRNTLMQMASASDHDNSTIRLFNYRLDRYDKENSNEQLHKELKTFLNNGEEEHLLIQDLPINMRRMSKTYLRLFIDKISSDFDLKRGSIGNFILAGIYFASNRDINTALYTFQNMWGITNHKVFLNTTEGGFHIRAYYQGTAETVEYQHLITEVQEDDVSKKIRQIEIYHFDDPKKRPKINDVLYEELSLNHNNMNHTCFRAVIFGPGSFFTSIVQHLYVDKVIEAVQGVLAPAKILIVGFKKDKENFDYTQADLIEQFCAIVENKLLSNKLDSVITHAFVHSAKVANEEFMEIGDLDKVKENYSIQIVSFDMEDQWNLGNFDAKIICDKIQEIIKTPCLDNQDETITESVKI